jgi:hypothetical protein
MPGEHAFAILCRACLDVILCKACLDGLESAGCRRRPPAPPAPSQLCHLLRLRAIAVVSAESDFDKTALWLRALGAAEVLKDQGSLKVGTSHTLVCGCSLGVVVGGNWWVGYGGVKAVGMRATRHPSLMERRCLPRGACIKAETT